MEAEPTKTNPKAAAVMLMDMLTQRSRLTDGASSNDAGLVVGFNEKTVWIQQKYFYANRGEFPELA